MSRIILCIIIVLLTAARGSQAHQIDMADHYMSEIKSALTADTITAANIDKISQRITDSDPVIVCTTFDQIIYETTKQGDEHTACCASVMATVYFVNHNDYNKALQYVNSAISYNHDQSRAIYLNFLKGMICTQLEKFDMGYELLSQVIAAENGAMLGVLKCESYRFVADYYKHYYNVVKALEALQIYTDMCDTVTCNAVAPAYFVLPDYMRYKYIERQVITQKTQPDGNRSVGLIVLLSAGGLLLLAGAAFAVSKYAAIGKTATKLSQTKTSKGNIGNVAAGVSSAWALAAAANTSDAFIVLDRNGKIDYVNPGFEKLYGQNLRQYILSNGENLFVSGNVQRRLALEMCRNNKSQQTCQFETKIGSKRLWIQSQISPVVDNNDIASYVITESDITQLKLQQGSANFAVINKQITGSLRSAQTIQQSMLPEPEFISNFYQSFVIYKPKDIVSGDFYWFRHNERVDETIVAVGDCAGHGVPGALMSVFMMRLLDETVSAHPDFSPAKILSEMEEKVEQTLNTRSQNFSGGMDISIARIKRSKGEANVTLAGAKSYFVFYSHAQHSAELIKGTKKSIGSSNSDLKQREFENHEFPLMQGDRLFLSSDGFIDQNNIERKCFGSQRFTDVIENSSDMLINSQKKYIEEALQQWQQDQPQRDDICVVALQI